MFPKPSKVQFSQPLRKPKEYNYFLAWTHPLFMYQYATLNKLNRKYYTIPKQSQNGSQN